LLFSGLLTECSDWRQHAGTLHVFIYNGKIINKIIFILLIKLILTVNIIVTVGN